MAEQRQPAASDSDTHPQRPKEGREHAIDQTGGRDHDQ
jgi:hypothetical protein